MAIRPKQIDRTRKRGWFEDHFLGNAPGGSLPLISALGSAGSIVNTSSATEINRPGIMRLSTTVSLSTGWALLRSSASINLGGGNWDFVATFRVVNAPTSSENSTHRIGFGDSTDNNAPVDGVYLYADSTNANFRWITVNNSTATNTDSSVAIAGNTWFDMLIRVSAGVAYCTLGTTTKTISTNVPKTAGRDTGLIFQTTKTTGMTLAGILDVDYYSLDWELD